MQFHYASIAERDRFIEHARSNLIVFTQVFVSKEFEPGQEGGILEHLELLTKQLREAIEGTVQES